MLGFNSAIARYGRARTAGPAIRNTEALFDLLYPNKNRAQVSRSSTYEASPMIGASVGSNNTFGNVIAYHTPFEDTVSSISTNASAFEYAVSSTAPVEEKSAGFLKFYSYSFSATSIGSTKESFFAITAGTVSEYTATNIALLAEIRAAGLAWLLAEGERNQTTLEQLSAMYGAIHTLMKRGNFAVVDELLNQANPAKLSLTASIALLRYSSLAREKLAQWDRLLLRVKAELKSKNIDAKSLLMGLPGA